VLHGGAKPIPEAARAAHREGCLAALAAGRERLERGGRALDAVEAAVRILEDDPTFNAGFGSVRNADGEVEMDAAVMEGAQLGIGAVAALLGVRHPVSVARALLSERPILLVGEGARRFAREHDLELCAPADMIAPTPSDPCDTVGCVARDDRGDIAVATSTGGLAGVAPGRVGDSPMPGCGYYADNATGGVCFSGEGEAIARVLLAARTIAAMALEPPERALGRMLPLIKPLGGDGGGIAIDRSGRIGWMHNSPDFAVAYARSGEADRAFTRKDEEHQGS